MAFPVIPAYAGFMDYAGGICVGGMPSMGGDLHSSNQSVYFNVNNNGIDGINRKMDGYGTSDIDRLFGIYAGVEAKVIFLDYYMVRIGANYGKSIYGGNGKTVFTTDNTNYYLLECQYAYTEYDFPLIIGLAIPFWKDVKISLGCGAAFAMGKYENKFESETYPDPFERESSSLATWIFTLY